MVKNEKEVWREKVYHRMSQERDLQFPHYPSWILAQGVKVQGFNYEP